MGSGLNKIKNLVLRRVKDKIRKYYRISTYSATEGIGNRIHNYSQIISGPKILLGYAKTIYEILKKQPDLLRRNDLEVLLTAESLSKQQRLTWDEKSIVVNYEYGMAETNVIAYKIRERFANKYVVVREHILGACGKNNELLVTCLYGRRFPLIKYSTGDHLDLDELDRSNLLDFGSLLTFNDVQGRSNDFILIKYNDKSTRVHSEYFTHVLKTIAGIHKFIVLQKSCDTIEVFVDCENNVDLAAISNTILDKIPMENKVIVKRKALQNNKAGKANYNSI
jgi:phenylacetate-coenzyme A ligase PaaK-like adenylate-forming protein